MAKTPEGERYDERYQYNRSTKWSAARGHFVVERRNVWLPRAIMLAVEMMEMGIDAEQGRRIAHDTDFVLAQMVDGVPPNTI